MIDKLLKQYSIVLSQEVIWGDMDAFDHINNTVYFRYFEDARMAYLEKVGILEHKAKENMGPILAKTDCNFKLPVKYPDRIIVAARSKILSPKKFEMEYLIWSENLKGVAAEGSGLLIYYDYVTGRSCEIPQNIVDAMRKLEEH
jgi:acyl-CoA thioester hydrolase